MRKLIFIMSLAALSCNSNEHKSTEKETNTERTSAKLEVNSDEIKIGNQVWMTKNLNVDKFNNGDPIPEAKTAEEWAKAGENKQPAWCYYENNPANGTKYGRIYNWYAVNDLRGLAPTGWYVPSHEEWTELMIFLGGFESGIKIKSTIGWNENGNGNNESGFSGLPGGARYSDGTFGNIGELGFWWSSGNPYAESAEIFKLHYENIDNKSPIKIDQWTKERGLSVRCLRDLTETSSQ